MKNSIKPLPYFFIGSSACNDRKSKYITEKHPQLCTLLGKEDTRSIWYTRDHIAKLLEEIDYLGGDGLRIYLGAYENGHEFEGQLCLVMNATREQSTGGVISHVDVLLEEEPDFTDRSTASRDFEPTTKKPKDYNFGSPCPPRC